MNKKIILGISGIITIILLVIVLSSWQSPDYSEKEKTNLDLSIYPHDFMIPGEGEWIEVQSNSLFKTFVQQENFIILDDQLIWKRTIFQLKPELSEIYEQLKAKKPNEAVVVYPIFTATAYSEPGFYTYYRGECDESCLTLTIKNIMNTHSSPNAVQVFNLLNYDIITDIDVDKDPTILKKYEKVILLHNEYVTEREFNAIITHPKVIFVYPNTLYAKIDVNYEKNTITLIRGHNYPSPEITNGFDWEFDNTHPYEYDTKCLDPQFYNITNGWMLNCYPEDLIHRSDNLLYLIKKL